MSAVAHITDYKKGKFYSDDYRGTMSWNGYENNVLLRNEGRGEKGSLSFVDVAMALGADDIGDSRGIALVDFDNDGDLDLAVNHNPGDYGVETAPARLLRNDIGHQRSWLAVELEGTTVNRDAVGAVVIIETGDQSQMRLKSLGSSYASQHSARLYFGLGEAEQVDRLTVRWPGGGEEVFGTIDARQVVRIVQGQGHEVAPLPGTEKDPAEALGP